jgi:predicted AlkP superfamily pyrophosphatase or phosphodiesterase
MKGLISIVFIFFAFGFQSQVDKPPKLIVGIVVDQMIYDYLYRYQDRFGKKGFNLLMKKGASCTNAVYSYVPTYTGPGHASIYTGTVPSNHGIVGNEWFDRKSGEVVNCVTDSNYFSVGTESNYGLRSPANLTCMTITDQLKYNSPKSKVVSLSIKDRSAILPGGHKPDGCYWFDYLSGHFITSQYYTQDLPEWVKEFNALNYPIEAMKKTWNSLYPIETYVASGPDDSPYEILLPTKETPTFPYDFAKMTGGKTDMSLFTTTPFANTYLTDMAIASLVQENMGRNGFTDMLCLSYSSTDILGHGFGTRSIEIEDMYLRLDLEIEKLIKAIKKQVGNDFTLFLTADHAVVPTPQELMDKNMPGGYIFLNPLMTDLSDLVKAKFGADFILRLENLNIYLDNEVMEFMGVKKTKLESFIQEEISKWEGVKGVFTTTELQSNSIDSKHIQMVKAGYDDYRSGNVIFTLLPGFLPKYKDTELSRKGTSHGSAHNYDTHVPLIFFGKNIEPQQISRRVDISDIAVTLSQLLQMQKPFCSDGEPIIEILAK